MANICLYKIKVVGTKDACFALVNMMPLYSWEKEFINEDGTDENYSLIFSGGCKWSVDSYTKELDNPVPYNNEKIKNIQDGDGWDICLRDKSLLLGIEVFCNSKDIDDSSYAKFVHYNKGEFINDGCPKELHIKRGRDYDYDYDVTASWQQKKKELPAVKSNLSLAHIGIRATLI